MKKNICLILMLACLCANAQPGGGGITEKIMFTPPPEHPELQEVKGCGCQSKNPVFSCSPDCDGFTIETITAPVTENVVMRITATQTFTVEFTFEDGSTFSYDGIISCTFNYAVCEMYYPEFRVGRPIRIKYFTSIKIVK